MSLAEKFAKNTKLKGAGLLSKKVEVEPTTYDTKIPALNLAFSGHIDKGFSSGITCIAGRSKSFKTLFGLILCKAYLDAEPDAYMIFYDSEGGASADYFESVGIDTNRVIYIPIMNIEELKFDMVEKLDEIKKQYTDTKTYAKFIWFIDSLGNLASVKEVQDALDAKSVADMTRAKAMKSLFRIITPYFKNYEMQLISIMHTYDEIGGMGAPRQIMSGGCLVAGTKVLTVDGEKNIEDIKVGDYVIADDHTTTKVINAWTPETLEVGYADCYEITFEDGSKVQCTGEHKFLVDGVWTELKRIQPGTFVEDI